MNRIRLMSILIGIYLLCWAQHSALGGVIISEIVARNENSLKTAEGDAPDWIELYNSGSDSVNLGGYALTDGDGSPDKGWQFPSNTVISPGQTLVVYADDNAEKGGLHAGFKLSGSGESVYLFDSNGNELSKLTFPALLDDQSFGVGAGDTVYKILQRPTPGQWPNAGAVMPGPFLIVDNPSGPANGNIEVKASIVDGVDGSSVQTQDVVLRYKVDYDDQEEQIPMRPSGSNGEYSAVIPAQKKGSMVRWYVTATDSSGAMSRFPSFSDPSAAEYYGTFMDDPSMATSLPVLYLACKNNNAPYLEDKEASPGCSVMINGNFYDNIIVRRRGVSSVNWPKPKFKIDAGSQGKIFQIYEGDNRKVKEFNMNSEWFEPGVNSFMRETIGWKALKEMGVDSLDYYQTQVRFNGDYFGKFSLGEDWDIDPLKEAGYSVEPEPGILMKSISGEYSNLRWDVDSFRAKYYYRPITQDTNDAFKELADFAKGLSGGIGGSRAKYIFDNVNLPKVVNSMAAQTILLNQDRCTKNFYVYQDPSSGQWTMLPWDVESTFGIDRGFKGKPAIDYCILECEQWYVDYSLL